MAIGVVAWYQERFGRGPTRAKAYLHEDYVLVVLGEVQSKAERTLVEQGDATSVINLRRAIKQAHKEALCELVSDLTGRSVHIMLSDHNPYEDISAMVFLFERQT